MLASLLCCPSQCSAWQSRHWVRPFRSGPLGGDAQIAELILKRECRRVLFLEDPHVARQHEADIQLLERAACTVTDFASCSSDVSAALAELAGLAQPRPEVGLKLI